MSIARFPSFSRLDCDCREELEAFTRHFPPYSDFSFTNLYVYDSAGATRLAMLDGHLIVEMPDHHMSGTMYTFLGHNGTRRIADALHEWAGRGNAGIRLSCVPEVSLAHPPASSNGYCALPQRDCFDYVFNIEATVNLTSSAYAHKRQKTNQFRRHHPNYSVRMIDVADVRTRLAIESLLECWRIEKHRTHEEVRPEYTALYRCFDKPIRHGIVGVGIFIDELLVGFSLSELAHGGYCLMHFIKAVPTYKGLAEILMQETARTMASLGCVYLNMQDDAGIQGLRYTKMSWQPASFLRKFEIRCEERTSE